MAAKLTSENLFVLAAAAFNKIDWSNVGEWHAKLVSDLTEKAIVLQDRENHMALHEAQIGLGTPPGVSH